MLLKRVLTWPERLLLIGSYMVLFAIAVAVGFALDQFGVVSAGWAFVVVLPAAFFTPHVVERAQAKVEAQAFARGSMYAGVKTDRGLTWVRVDPRDRPASGTSLGPHDPSTG